MDVLEIGDFAEFSNRHDTDWQRIANQSLCATVFQTWEWLAAWWQHHRSGKRFLGLVFREGGEIVGLAALYAPALPTLFRTWRLVGTGGSDYLDIIAAPGSEEAVSGAFRAALGARRRRWDWVDLQQVRPGAVLDRVDAAVAPSRGGEVGIRAWRGETCPYLALGPDWETTRKALGKKLRQNVGYYARALEKGYLVEYRTSTAETLNDDLDAFFDLHQRRWNQRWMPGAFASRRERAFHADAARRLLDADMLRLHTLTLDGDIQAALYCFQKSGVCHYYLSGFEPKYARLSIGTVLTAHAIRFAIEQDLATEFDFLRGDEPYKYRWGANDRFNRRLSVTHTGVRPALLQAAGRMSLSAEQAIKSRMHKGHGGVTKAAPNA